MKNNMFNSKFMHLYNLVMESVKKAETDPHELMTACLLLVDNLSFYTNNKNDITIEHLDILLNKIKSIVENSNKIKDASVSQIKALDTYTRKYNALCQAISAAAMIKEKNPGEISEIYLTGNKPCNEISEYFGIKNLIKKGINSYAMKDFNSSDIVLKIGERFKGISLKKKEKINSADPPLTNVALSIFFKDLTKIDDMFSDFYGYCITKHVDVFFNEEIQMKLFYDYKEGKLEYFDKNPKESKKSYKDRVIKVQKNEFVENFRDSLNNPTFTTKNWKSLLSSSNGLFSTNENKEIIRSYLNEDLKSDKSVLPKIDKEIISKSEEIGTAFLHIVFKDTLEKLNDYKFDFSLCVGIGRVLKNSIIIDDAEYKSVQDVTSTLRKIGENEDKGKIIPSRNLLKNNNDRFSNNKNENENEIEIEKNNDDNKPVIAAKLFYDLKFGNTVVANIEVRYKGSYTSYPQFFATFDEDFIKNLKNRKNEENE